MFDDRLKAKGINSLSDNELFDESDEDDEDDEVGRFGGRTGRADFDRLRLNIKESLCFSIITFVNSLNISFGWGTNCTC